MCLSAKYHPLVIISFVVNIINVLSVACTVFALVFEYLAEYLVLWTRKVTSYASFTFAYTVLHKQLSMQQSVLCWIIKTAAQLLISHIHTTVHFWGEAARQQADKGRFILHLVGQAKLFVFGKPTALHPLTQMKIA